jgi:hypothetical protein
MTARKRKKPKKWVQGANLHKGALHKDLGIPEGHKIPISILKKAIKKGGKTGRRAQLALTLRKMRHR